GVEVDGGAFHALHQFGTHRRHPILALEDPADDQKFLLEDGEPVPGKKVRAHDDVGDAGLILEREEHETLGGAGTLTRDDPSGDANAASLTRGVEIDGPHDAARGELAAAKR